MKPRENSHLNVDTAASSVTYTDNPDNSKL